MNKGDSKSKRKMARKVKKLQNDVKILEFKVEMKDKRIETLEKTINDLEEQLNGKDEGRVDEETVGTGDAGLDGASGGNDDNLQSGESGIGDQVGTAQ